MVLARRFFGGVHRGAGFFSGFNRLPDPVSVPGHRAGVEPVRPFGHLPKIESKRELPPLNRIELQEGNSVSAFHSYGSGRGGQC